MPPPHSAKADFPKFQPPVSTGGRSFGGICSTGRHSFTLPTFFTHGRFRRGRGRPAPNPPPHKRVTTCLRFGCSAFILSRENVVRSVHLGRTRSPSACTGRLQTHPPLNASS